jgi:hypothetical protein
MKNLISNKNYKQYIGYVVIVDNHINPLYVGKKSLPKTSKGIIVDCREKPIIDSHTLCVLVGIGTDKLEIRGYDNSDVIKIEGKLSDQAPGHILST